MNFFLQKFFFYFSDLRKNLRKKVNSKTLLFTFIFRNYAKKFFTSLFTFIPSNSNLVSMNFTPSNISSSDFGSFLNNPKNIHPDPPTHSSFFVHLPPNSFNILLHSYVVLFSLYLFDINNDFLYKIYIISTCG